jgi:hypothetical protein
MSASGPHLFPFLRVIKTLSESVRKVMAISDDQLCPATGDLSES